MSKSSTQDGTSIFHRITLLGLQFFAVLAVITFMPGLPPDDEFRYYKLNIQPVTLNGKLNNAEKLFLNEVKGPEDLAVYRNELYTTCHGGYVQKIKNGKLVPVVRFGKDCKGIHEEHICGRPLGLRFDSKGALYVADAYYGVFKVNISTGAVSNLVSMKEPIEGVKPMMPNGVAVSEKTGDLYWTDSSTSHRLYDGVYTFFSNGNGRLIKYSAAKGKNEVLLKNLHFPNGVALSKDETFIVIAESFRARLLKYHLKGLKAGQSEVFAELPGFPDNVVYNGGKFSANIMVIDSLVQMLPEWPVVRKLVSRLATLVELFIGEVDALYPSELLQKASHMIGHFETLTGFCKPGHVIQTFHENGKLAETLSATDGRIQGISSFVAFQGYYYLGSPFNNYLARVKAV